MRTPTLAAIVLTLNEEQHLPACLDSLDGCADQVIVVDSGSTDRTVELASQAGVSVIHSPFTGYASQRNKALDLVSDCDWVLFLDADERLTEASRVEIRDSIACADDSTAGFWIPRRNIAFGKELKGGGWWPDYQARLIRAGRGRYRDDREVHEIVDFTGETRHLSEPLIHINYESRGEYLRKQRAYTLRLARDGHLTPPRPYSYLTRPAREFIRRFVRLRGYRDGLTGIFLASAMALEELRACFLARRGHAQ